MKKRLIFLLLPLLLFTGVLFAACDHSADSHPPQSQGEPCDSELRSLCERVKSTCGG